MKNQSFEEKVKSMTAREIITAMVDGLRKEHVRVDMTSFGEVRRRDSGKEVCYGCAATNAVCEIAGETNRLAL